MYIAMCSPWVKFGTTEGIKNKKQDHQNTESFKYHISI